jgi:hypothetical protein
MYVVEKILFEENSKFDLGQLVSRSVLLKGKVENKT